MKKALILLVLVLLVSSVSGCKDNFLESPAHGRTIKVGMTLYDGFDTFIGLLSEQFIAKAREKEQTEGATITVMLDSADNNQFTQNNQVERFIESGCDVICVNLVDRTDATVIIDKAEAAGIPVVFFNRELVEEDLERGDNLFYVGAPAPQSGVLQGEIVAEYCRGNMDKVDKNADGILQYVMLEGQTGHQDTILRTETSVRTVRESGINLERLEDEIANWARAQGETRMNQWIQTYGNSIEIVFSNNDEMALGAIDALRKTAVKRADWPVIVGIDGVPEGIEAVADGVMAGTVLNDARGQAEALLELVWASTTGNPVSDKYELESGKYIRVPYRAITMDNVTDFLDYY